MDVVTTAIIAAVPSSILGLVFGLIQYKLQKHLDKAEKANEAARQSTREAEARREKCQLLLLDSVNASIKLSEAIAEGCKKSGLSGFNGNVEEAMQYAKDVKYAQDRFYRDEGVKAIYN